MEINTSPRPKAPCGAPSGEECVLQSVSVLLRRFEYQRTVIRNGLS